MGRTTWRRRPWFPAARPGEPPGVVAGGLAVLVVVVDVVVAAIVLGVPQPWAGGRRRAAAGPRERATPTSPAKAVTTHEPAAGIDGPGTSLGPDGVEATRVVLQDTLPGSTAWRITGSWTAREVIEGLADRTAAHAGERAAFAVATTSPTYRVEAFRTGWHQGKGARLAWGSPVERGVDQPPCPVTPGVSMVTCYSWSPSFTVTITPSWVQGDYLLKLVASQGEQQHVPLTVRDPSARAAYLIKSDVLTWQAWSPFGGYDLYVGHGRCPPGHYPLCSRARVVSFDHPYGYGEGAGDLLGNELALVSGRSSMAWTWPTPTTSWSRPTRASFFARGRCCPSATTSAGISERARRRSRRAGRGSTSCPSAPAPSSAMSASRPRRFVRTGRRWTTGARSPTRWTATATPSR